MKTPTSPRPRTRVLLRIGVLVSLPFGLLASCLLMDQIPMSAARPPSHVQTMDDFIAWKGSGIKGHGLYRHSNMTYTVMLAPAGRFIASGPSAYLFDEHGRFVDWTADMGDFRTVRKRLDLSGGRVQDIKRERP